MLVNNVLTDQKPAKAEWQSKIVIIKTGMLIVSKDAQEIELWLSGSLPEDARAFIVVILCIRI
jgi:hypothetical protein